MAEESVDLAVTSGKTKLDAAYTRRNSTGKSSSSRSGQNIPPHYLRASTGSCHDFCKYGREHTFEAKAKQPLQKRITATKDDSNRKSPKSAILAESKKMIVAKLKPLPNSKSHVPGNPKIITREVSSSSTKLEVSSKPASPNAKEANLPTKRSISSKPKPVPEMLSVSSSLDSSAGLNGQTINDVRAGKKTEIPKVVVKKAPIPLTASLSSKPSLQKVPSFNAKRHRILKVVTPLRNKNLIWRAESKPSNEDKAREKILPAPLLAAIPSKPSVNRDTGLKKRIPKVASPLKNQNMGRRTEPRQSNNDNDKEKTLHVIKSLKVVKNQNRKPEPKKSNNNEDEENPSRIIKMERGSKTMGPAKKGSTANSLCSSLSSSLKSSPPLNSPSLSSLEEDQQYSEFTNSEEYDSISENDETPNLNEVETSEQKYKRRPRKAVMVLSEDNDCAPIKLTFRRGKVINIQSENNAPRRLRFRQGRVLGENKNVRGDDRRRSFKKREIVEGDTNEPGSETVVLRHQDVEGKKDAQSLFNNVIEETASKLAETRKSKVKALVGAFETVISLQESKTPTSTAS